ncbi:hypothetical protein [Acinetobacter defluvii]
MKLIFLFVGVIAAFSIDKSSAGLVNISLAILAVGCFACVVFLEKIEG